MPATLLFMTKVNLQDTSMYATIISLKSFKQEGKSTEFLVFGGIGQILSLPNHGTLNILSCYMIETCN